MHEYAFHGSSFVPELNSDMKRKVRDAVNTKDHITKMTDPMAAVFDSLVLSELINTTVVQFLPFYWMSKALFKRPSPGLIERAEQLWPLGAPGLPWQVILAVPPPSPLSPCALTRILATTPFPSHSPPPPYSPLHLTPNPSPSTYFECANQRPSRGRTSSTTTCATIQAL